MQPNHCTHIGPIMIPTFMILRRWSSRTSPIMSFFLGRWVIWGMRLIKFQWSVEDENMEKKQIEHSEKETNRAGLKEDGYKTKFHKNILSNRIVMNMRVLAMIAGVSVPAPVEDHHCQGGSNKNSDWNPRVITSQESSHNCQGGGDKEGDWNPGVRVTT